MMRLAARTTVQQLGLITRSGGRCIKLAYLTRTPYIQARMRVLPVALHPVPKRASSFRCKRGLPAVDDQFAIVPRALSRAYFEDVRLPRDVSLKPVSMTYSTMRVYGIRLIPRRCVQGFQIGRHLMAVLTMDSFERHISLDLRIL